LYRIPNDRAETLNVTKDHPEIVSRLTKLALDWKTTLPKKPNPDCLTTVLDPVKPAQPKKGANNPPVSPEEKAKTFDRWDTNRDGVLTLAEYLAGQKPNDLLEARFKNLDKNADGKLTKEEFVGKIVK
jgi:hypothetical protein